MGEFDYVSTRELDGPEVLHALQSTGKGTTESTRREASGT